MIAANIRSGVYLKRGIKNKSVTSTVNAIIMLDIAVCPPAFSFTADRENDPTNWNLSMGLKYEEI